MESNPLSARGQNPWILLVALILITLGGVFFIGQVLAFFTCYLIAGVGMQDLLAILQDPPAYPDQRVTVLVYQGMASFGGFVIAPLIFYFTMVRGNLRSDFLQLPENLPASLVVASVMTFSFMIINTVFIEWNASIKLPESMAGIESWAEGLEDSMEVLTKFLTNFDSAEYFLLAVLVIAVIPGFGEELLFRGFIQNLLKRIVKNDHLAVWTAAILFSAIHFQFYGFIPRMLLGALFGYLYIWSGNLIVPMVAHFVNNFVSLLALYVHQRGLTDIDVESTEALPTMYILIFSALFVVTVMYYKNYLAKPKAYE